MRTRWQSPKVFPACGCRNRYGSVCCIYRIVCSAARIKASVKRQYESNQWPLHTISRLRLAGLLVRSTNKTRLNPVLITSIPISRLTSSSDLQRTAISRGWLICLPGFDPPKLVYQRWSTNVDLQTLIYQSWASALNSTLRDHVKYLTIMTSCSSALAPLLTHVARQEETHIIAPSAETIDETEWDFWWTWKDSLTVNQYLTCREPRPFRRWDKAALQSSARRQRIRSGIWAQHAGRL